MRDEATDSTPAKTLDEESDRGSPDAVDDITPCEASNGGSEKVIATALVVFVGLSTVLAIFLPGSWSLLLRGRVILALLLIAMAVAVADPGSHHFRSISRRFFAAHRGVIALVCIVLSLVALGLTPISRAVYAIATAPPHRPIPKHLPLVPTPSVRPSPLSEVSGVEVTSGVANVTAGATKYKTAISADYNEVIAVQLVVSNFGPDPVTIMPALHYNTKPGVSQLISWSVQGAGTTQAVANSVTLSRPDASLVYLSNTSIWRHADKTGKRAYIDTTLKDSELFEPSAPLDTLQGGNPGGCAMSIQIRFGVFIPGARIDVLARNKLSGWLSSTVEQPGATIPLKIEFSNTGNTVLKGITGAFTLPSGLEQVGTSAVVVRPAGDKAPASTWQPAFGDRSPVPGTAARSFYIGDLQPGDTATFTTQIKLAKVSESEKPVVIFGYMITPYSYYYNVADLYVE